MLRDIVSRLVACLGWALVAWSPIAQANEGPDALDGSALFVLFADGHWGAMDRSGRTVAEPIYDALVDTATYFGVPASLLSPLHALPDGPVPVMRDGRWGYVGRNGRELVSPRYQSARTYREGLAAVRANDAWGFLDLDGREVIAPRYQQVDDFRDGVAAVREGGRWGLMGRDGQWRAKPTFEEIRRPQIGVGLAADPLPVKVDGRWGYVSLSGEPVIAPRFDRTGIFSEGLAPVEMNGLAGYIDVSGKVVIEPRFALAAPFSEGRALVRTERDRYGYIDRTGTLVIPAIYDHGVVFRGGLARVSISKHWICIDRDGRVVVPQECGDIDDGLVPVTRNGRGGWADTTGRIVIEPRFQKLGRFSEGVAPVQLDGRWGFVDRSGAMVIDPRYDHASSFNHGLAVVEYGDTVAYIDHGGKVVFEVNLPGRARLIKRF